MKPVIGIVTKPVSSTDGHLMYGSYDQIAKAIEQSGGIGIGVLPSKLDNEELILTLDGLIFQGGDDYDEYEKRYLCLAHEHNIPTLGICAGMQLMGEMFGGELIEIKNHKQKDKKYAHDIQINPESQLYQIIRQEKITVNSRHSFAIKAPNLTVSAISADGVIEALEDSNKQFFVGVQWHPENMVFYDEYQKKLFDNFINMCRGDL